MKPIFFFFKQRIKSLEYALSGIKLLISTEDNMKLHVLLVIIMSFLGIYFELSATEWLIQILTVAGVLSLEAINTTIEKLADFIHPEYHEKIKIIKNLAAGAVLIYALASLAVGIVIYFPKII